MRPSVRVPTPVTRFPGPVPGTCFAGPRSPRSPSLAPPAPQRIAPLCSSASLLLRRSQTSRARASSATTPHLPDAGLRNPPAGQTRDLPVPAQRASTHAQGLRPRRVGWALAITRPSMLPSVKTNTSAPGTFKLSRLYGWPMRSPADASSSPSRMPTHGSGPMRIATPSLQWTCTTYSLPVSTGAPFFLFYGDHPWGPASHESICDDLIGSAYHDSGRHGFETGLLARNGDGGVGDGPRDATLPCLTYKIPRYADRQPYNGKVMEAGLLICN